MKKAESPRSACPINYSLEMLGDKWSLLILRDIIQFGKNTYGDFVTSDEKIARNILASRLSKLQREGMVTKRPHPQDKRKDIYEVTEKGLAVIPILLDMSEWGSGYGTPPDAMLTAWLELVRTRRAEVITNIRVAVKEGRSTFGGTDSVAAQMLLP